MQANGGSLSSAAAGTAQSTDSSTAGAGTGSSGDQHGQPAPARRIPAATSGNGAGPLLGGGPMLGVISKSKAEGIHSFNDKSKYNEWYFIYDPSQDNGRECS